MASLMTGIDAQVQLIMAKSAGAKTLSDAITEPNGNFTAGIASVQSAIGTVTSNLKVLEDAASMPGADPSIGMGIVADQGAITWLQGLQSTLQSIINANDGMEEALSQDLVVWQTLEVKYQAVTEALKSATTGPGILGSGDVKAAQAGWAQIETARRGYDAAHQGSCELPDRVGGFRASAGRSAAARRRDCDRGPAR